MSPLIAPLLEAAGVRHAFFTRQGGVSTGLYASLNLGRGSNDDPAAVAENRARAAAHLGVEPAALLACYQIHSAVAHLAETPWGDYRPEGDAIVTNKPGLACGVLAADCAPVLIADPVAGVVGAAHAGWKGALGGIVRATVKAMAARGARPQRMVAAVGPCIGPGSYEVGPEFFERFAAEAPWSERFFAPAADGRRMFDLPHFVLAQLERSGVEHAEWIGRDTCAEEALFFSNRRAFKRGEPDYGRQMSAVRL